MAKMFRKGKIIKTVDELLECRTDGSGYVFYRNRPICFSFVGHMNLFTILGGLANQNFRRAIRKVNANL